MIKNRIILLKSSKSITNNLQTKLIKLKYKKIYTISNLKDVLLKKDDILIVDLNRLNYYSLLNEINNILEKHPIPIIFIFNKKDQKLFKKTLDTKPVGYLYNRIKGKHLNAIIRLASKRYDPIIPKSQS